MSIVLCQPIRCEYLPGPIISGHDVRLQNSDTVPYNKLMCSKKPIAETVEFTDHSLKIIIDTHCVEHATHWRQDLMAPQ